MTDNSLNNSRPALVAAYLLSVESYRLKAERLFDDRFSRELIPSAWKISLLPGFDARAYRIPGIQQVHVFELDLPDPQRLKQTYVKNILGELPAHVSYVPIDFDRQDIDGVMTTVGFQIAEKIVHNGRIA